MVAMSANWSYTPPSMLAAEQTVLVMIDVQGKLAQLMHNRQIGLDRMRAAGAGSTCAETVLFELLRTAESPKFKEVARLLK